MASCDAPVTREDAAAAVGISRTLAAYHLDKLAEFGILTVNYARPSDRTGPGAGRPAKRYMRSQQELSASVPPRNYALLAKLLAEAVAADDSGIVASTLAQLARQAGRDSAYGHDVVETLHNSGYEPAWTSSGEIEFRNCPFRQLASQYPELVCGLNLEMVCGMLEARGEPPSRAVLAPRQNRCCIVVRASQNLRRDVRRSV